MMTRIKKITAFLLAILLLIAVSGCNKNDSKEASASSNQSISAAGSKPTTSDSASDSKPDSTGTAVDDTFFDDAVFIGDSVTLKLSYYVDKIRNNIGLPCMGNAQFLCSGSLGYANAMWDIDDPNNVHPSYQGTTYLVQDGVAAIGAKKVFIMLGMNDFSLYGTETTVDNAKALIGKILEKTPDASIYVQSVTPIISGKESGSFTNANVVLLNKAIEAMCSENGYRYINVAEVLMDDNGCLVNSYCSDPDAQGIHFTDEACDIWIKYLQAHAG